MGKIKNIIDGYRNLVTEDKVLQPLFDSRYNTCKNCPGDNNKLGICVLCGCIVKAKTHSPLENCPSEEQYWLPRFYVDNEFEYVLKSEIPVELQHNFEEEEIPLTEWQGFLAMNHVDEEDEDATTT